MSLIKPSGWTDTAENIFNQAGELAGAAWTYLSGRSKENRDAVREEQGEQAQALRDIGLAEQEQETQKLKLAALVKRYWWVLLIVGGGLLLLLLWKPLMRMLNVKRRGNPGKRRYRSKSVTKTKSGKRRSKRSSRGFSRKIHGRTYTSKESWSKAMRNLRKK